MGMRGSRLSRACNFHSFCSVSTICFTHAMREPRFLVFLPVYTQCERSLSAVPPKLGGGGGGVDQCVHTMYDDALRNVGFARSVSAP